MPLFDFRCRDCGALFETLCRDSKTTDVRCPSCGATAPDRLMFVFSMSRSLTPCGTRASEAPASCGAGGCGSCCGLD